jgi:hypothetical protein
VSRPHFTDDVLTALEWYLYTLCEAWNMRGEDDDDGALEHELEAYGFETRRPNGRPNRRLQWDDPDEWGRFFSDNCAA